MCVSGSQEKKNMSHARFFAANNSIKQVLTAFRVSLTSIYQVCVHRVLGGVWALQREIKVNECQTVTQHAARLTMIFVRRDRHSNIVRLDEALIFLCSTKSYCIGKRMEEMVRAELAQQDNRAPYIQRLQSSRDGCEFGSLYHISLPHSLPISCQHQLT